MGHYQIIKLNDYNGGVARSHLYRYYAARGYVDPGDVVVDAASGAGYGTELLSAVASKVVGIERDPDAVKYAMLNHKEENNYFMVGNLDQMEKYPLCDVFISLETIEHLRYPESFAAKVKTATRKKIVLSCPIVPTKHEDSTHLHDFNEAIITAMFVDDQWGVIDSAHQGPYLIISFFRK